MSDNDDYVNRISFLLQEDLQCIAIQALVESYQRSTFYEYFQFFDLDFPFDSGSGEGSGWLLQSACKASPHCELFPAFLQYPGESERKECVRKGRRREVLLLGCLDSRMRGFAGWFQT
jgi:hypothetical protein